MKKNGKRTECQSKGIVYYCQYEATLGDVGKHHAEPALRKCEFTQWFSDGYKPLWTQPIPLDKCRIDKCPHHIIPKGIWFVDACFEIK